jgi:type I restriction enzyme M protein
MRPLATRRRELLPAFQLVTRGAATILALDNPPISMARKRAITGAETAGNTAALGFEAKLWLAADKLRNNMDAAEYKHVVLGLIFLKYISDSFDEHHAKLVAGKGDFAGANPEDKDEYLAANVFWVPKEARWAHLQANAKLPSIGKDVDDAMVALERYNPRLKGALNKNYGRADLDKHRLGELIDLIGSIQLADVASRSKDLLGRVFEYFLTQFASAEGKNGGQFYTPSCVVRLLVEMLAPYKGRIYDPACGSGGMFVQSEKFVESHGGSLGDISIYGQGSNPTTRRLTTTTATATGVAVAVAVARSGSVSFSTCRLKRRIDSLSACKSRQVKIRCKSSYMANKLDFKQQVAILGES